MRDHHQLRAFQLADEVALLVYRETSGFPKEEMFGLVSQLRRGAVSVASNIVEGCARSSEAEYLQFLNIAFGAIRELNYQFDLSMRLSFSSNAAVLDKISETERVLAALIRALRPPRKKTT